MAQSGNQLVYRPGPVGRGSLLQRLRLWSGLVLFAYVFVHYLNHALGNVSLAAMEAVLHWQEFVWGSPPGQLLLYGSLIVHVALGMFRLLRIRTWRRPFWEWAQIALGLAIPWLLISHVIYTRGAQVELGLDVSYVHELGLMWPDVWISQSALLLIVWVHAIVGIHFWLRIRNGYQRWFPVLVGVAVIWPTLALTGWISAARRLFDIVQLAPDSKFSLNRANFNQFIIHALKGEEWEAKYTALTVIGIVVAIMALRWFLQRFARRVRVTYGDGTEVTVPPGQTLLEISRANGIPHMSVCGGRARCSTCRTLIVEGQENCGPVTDAEKLLLDKLNAGPDIRLACQCRVRGDMQVRPLIQPQSLTTPRNVDPLGWGVEREVAILFLDIRGFSRISEKSLPYDVVFILNSIFDEIGAEIEAANGYIDKFMGDGLMAIFGLAEPPREAARNAMRAALAAVDSASGSSRILTHHLSEPIRIGVGIDTGTVVIGRIGRTSDQTEPSRLTAIGDTVNIAARLESVTKELRVPIVLSKHAIETAGIKLTGEIGVEANINVHNISEAVDVVAISDPEPLRKELGGETRRAERRTRRRHGRFSFVSRLPTTRWTKAKKKG